MNKPIYRFLADRKWREYRRLILMQRITQMNVIPDVLPHFEPVVDVKMAFGKRSVQPGDFVESTVSERPCRLNIQSFTPGEKLVSIAIVDSDVPNVEKDGFDSRCHFLAANISISPTTPSVILAQLSNTSQVMLPWLPPTAQKGSPYHRLSLLVLAQKGSMPIDVTAASSSPPQRDGFSMRSFVARHLVSPIGVTLFRCKWDEGTAQVMRRHGIEGADIEFKRRKVEPLPYKRRNPSSFR
jgi:large subunit ribosomal protein L35